MICLWLCDVMLCDVSCHVMSCHVMSCHVIEERELMSCHVVSCRVVSCHVMSCHVMSCHVSVLEKMIEHQSSLIANLTRPRAEEKDETGVQAHRYADSQPNRRS